MLNRKAPIGTLASLFVVTLSACQGTASEPSPDLAPAPDLSPRPIPKAVYTTSNEVAGNRVFAYTRAADGTLSALGAYATGGKGTGAGLGDQNALVFDAARGLFFAVNAGDNSISMLALQADGGLALRANVPSGGVRPVSITSAGDVVYTVNAGDANTAGNIAGFRISGETLTAIPGATRPLSAAATGPAQIQFTPSGGLLVVTEKMTNKIDTYAVTAGVAGAPMVQNSAGVTPFGFAFSAEGRLLVSEAAGAMANKGSTSSYAVAASGALTPVSSAVASGQTAPCWVAVIGSTAYVTNAQTNNITAYRVAADGMLTLLSNGVSATTGMGPTDLDATDGNDLLYVLSGRDHAFSIYGVNADGTLTRKPDFTGLPDTAVGLVAR